MRRLPASTRASASRLRVEFRRFAPAAIALGALAAAALLIGFVIRPFDSVRVGVVQDGLEHPWDIAFAADGRMLVTERAGRIRVYESAVPRAALLHTATVPEVHAELESGVMGIAVDADAVFVCATRGSPEDLRIDLLRSTLAGDGTLAPFEPMAIGEAIGAPRHQGCAVEVAGGHLWVTLGDANLPPDEHPSQDPDRLNGKVLRLGLDGTPAPDNPFGNPVYTIGHRNPQGIAFRDGLIVEVEHGTDENDEINVLVPGGNYGYPCVTGAADPGPYPETCDAAEFIEPAWASGSTTLATSAATFLRGSRWGDWEGDLIVSTLKEEDLRRFSVAADGAVELEETLLDGRFGRLRAVVIGPDGALYVSTTNGDGDRIVRLAR